MANGLTFSVEVSKVLGGLNLVNVKVNEKAKEGMGRALLQLKSDTVMQKPTAPLDEGWLRGSCSIFVQEKKLDIPPQANEKTGKQAESSGIKPGLFEILGVIGFNVPYAARWHEVPANFKEPSAGNKYLESKMSGNRALYIKIIANAIKEADRA